MARVEIYSESILSHGGSMSLSRLLRSQPQWLLLVELSLLLGVIGWLDYRTGWELSFFVFYAVPIFMAVWFVGRTTALVFAVAGALMWWFANFGEHPYQTPWGYWLATVSRFVYFLSVAIGGAALKAHRDADSARIAALERMRHLEQQILWASEREQQRIGRDLHDGLCQYLAALGFSAQTLADRLSKASQPHAVEAREIALLLRNAVTQARSLARGIHPVQADPAGLSIALDELAATTRQLTSLNVSFEESGDTRLDDANTATQLFRIAQEALSNAMKHSEASHITFSLERRDGVLELRVTDNGNGFVRTTPDGRGLGMDTMTFRARSVGAELRIESEPGKGTSVLCYLPLGEL